MFMIVFKNHSRCPSWTNVAGDHISAISRCQEDGTWSASAPSPPGDLLFPSSLASPVSPDISCTCPTLLLTYNPNKEPGAEFHCSNPIDWDQLPVTLKSSDRCYLLCDYMLTATISCKDGKWTGLPGKGLWCNHEAAPLSVLAKESPPSIDNETTKVKKQSEKEEPKNKLIANEKLVRNSTPSDISIPENEIKLLDDETSIPDTTEQVTTL